MAGDIMIGRLQKYKSCCEYKVDLRRLFEWLISLGQLPSDSSETRLQKSLLCSSTILMATLAVFWGAIYGLGGELLSASIPWAYAVASAVSLLIFSQTNQYRVFAISQLSLSLLLPVALAFTLGNFVASSGVIIWSLSSPIGALLFVDKQQSVLWFLGFLCALAFYWLCGPYLSQVNDLPVEMRRLLFVMNFAGISALAFMLTYYFAVRRAEIQQDLETERLRSDALLRNVLPDTIAEQLKSGASSFASHYEEAGVLFADIVGFSTISQRLGPGRTVAFLNRIHTEFDALTEKFGIEKIRSIGDGYMAASGVPTPRPDHVSGIAKLALEMKRISDQPCEGVNFDLRIGICVGPLMAGVIGTHKFCYDVWGSTVNLAQRMESNGLPGCIQVCSNTREVLGAEFTFEPRGAINAKGFGIVNSYWLVGQ